MNKQEFVNYIANQRSCTKVKAEEIIDIFTASVMEALGQGNEILLVGFGQFYTTKVKAKNGRNPKNGQPINIPEQTLARFKAGQKLKNALNK
jgi:DNA-binding protein HU-beta